MFGLGMPEILLILAIALIVIGPQKLPELAKTLGRAMGEFKRSAQDLKKSIDLESSIQDVPAPSRDLKTVIKDVNTKKTNSDESKKDTDMSDAGDDVNAPAGSTDSSSSDDSENACIRNWIPVRYPACHPHQTQRINPMEDQNKSPFTEHLG